MGMMKRMKDMKDMVNAAPGMVQQAQQLGAQAQQMAAASQAAAQAQMAQAGGMQGYGTQPGVAPTGPDYDPISNVTLEQFAAVSKGVAAYNYDAAKLPEVAAAHGIASFDWDDASRGWNERIKANPAVAQRFNQLYRAS
jgi:membrane protease subunit (stomatin/prohibitin family)